MEQKVANMIQVYKERLASSWLADTRNSGQGYYQTQCHQEALYPATQRSCLNAIVVDENLSLFEMLKSYDRVEIRSMVGAKWNQTSGFGNGECLPTYGQYHTNPSRKPDCLSGYPAGAILWPADHLCHYDGWIHRVLLVQRRFADETASTTGGQSTSYQALYRANSNPDAVWRSVLVLRSMASWLFSGKLVALEQPRKKLASLPENSSPTLPHLDEGARRVHDF